MNGSVTHQDTDGAHRIPRILGRLRPWHHAIYHAHMPPASTDVIVVTGASSGIGHACATHLADHGATILAGYRAEEDGRRLGQHPSGRVVPVRLDITSPDDVRRIADHVAEHLAANPDNRLAGLVNNAGIGMLAPMAFTPLDDLRRILEVNVIGQVAMIQSLIEPLAASRGRVVNMSSISGRVAIPFGGLYCASKFALEAISDSLRLELEAGGIQVALIEPGVVESDIWTRTRAHAMSRLETLPPLGQTWYGAYLDALDDAFEETAATAIPAERVARCVEHALFATRPRHRYVVGRDAKIGAMLSRLLPSRWMDAMIRRQVRQLTSR